MAVAAGDQHLIPFRREIRDFLILFAATQAVQLKRMQEHAGVGQQPVQLRLKDMSRQSIQVPKRMVQDDQDRRQAVQLAKHLADGAVFAFGGTSPETIHPRFGQTSGKIVNSDMKFRFAERCGPLDRNRDILVFGRRF
jgi:hypothetical protein